MARVHRIGQTKTVHVYRMLSAGTVEERIVERAAKKLYLDQMVNRGTSNRDMTEEGGTSLSTTELLASLKFGSNAVFSSSNDMPTVRDIEHLTDRSRTEESSDGLLMGGVTKSASTFDKDKVRKSDIYVVPHRARVTHQRAETMPEGTDGYAPVLRGGLQKVAGRKGGQIEQWSQIQVLGQAQARLEGGANR
jgi:hypothetical protein